MIRLQWFLSSGFRITFSCVSRVNDVILLNHVVFAFPRALVPDKYLEYYLFWKYHLSLMCAQNMPASMFSPGVYVCTRKCCGFFAREELYAQFQLLLRCVRIICYLLAVCVCVCVQLRFSVLYECCTTCWSSSLLRQSPADCRLMSRRRGCWKARWRAAVNSNRCFAESFTCWLEVHCLSLTCLDHKDQQYVCNSLLMLSTDTDVLTFAKYYQDCRLGCCWWQCFCCILVPNDLSLYVTSGWRRGSLVRTSVCSWRTFPDLRLIHAWRVTISWVRRPLWVNQLGQLSLPSLRGR